MIIRISEQKCTYLGIVLFLMICSTVIIGCLNHNDISSLKIAILIQFTMFVVMFLVLGYTNKSLITLYSIFMIVFYLFQNGQLLLYSINEQFNFMYVDKFSVEQLYNSVYFSNLCMFSAFAAAIFSFDEKQGFFAKRIDPLSPKFIYDASVIGLIGTGIITFVLTIIKIIVWIQGRYAGVIVFETMVPSIIGLLELLFPAFCILTIVAGAKSGIRVRLVCLVFFVWGVITALIGDRTTGIGVVVIVLLMYYFGILTPLIERRKKVFYIGGMLSLVLITFAFSFRNQETFTFSSFYEVITNVIYELGFSFFPLAAIMAMCPFSHEFLNGSSMFSSLITGFSPESLDVFGFFSNVADQASIPTKWIANKYQYGFGMDCSLNAEVYANFGMYGFIAMFVICAVVSSCLKKVEYKNSKNIFSQYVGLALLFGWFTLPRRRSYYIYNKILWYVIIIGVFIGVLYLYTKNRGNYVETESE